MSEPKTFTGVEPLDIRAGWWGASCALRFVWRGEEKVLQQRWDQYFQSEPGMEFGRPFEWRDVPIEDPS